MTPPPVLWHVSFSNYAEKARWALDHKRVAHERRDVPPGLHPLVMRRVGGGRTVPVLVFGDGEVANDSTRIVAALERRYPEPPLYPEDPAQRARALELERVFSEQLGHDMRRLALDHVRRHPEALAPGAGRFAGAAVRAAAGPFGAAARRYFGTTPATVERAWRRLHETLDRFDAELGPEGYLAGPRFSVADLTFAALVGSLVGARGHPYPRFQGVPEVRELLAERGVLEWIEDLYARHRGEWVRP